jgi:hypothetical protein
MATQQSAATLHEYYSQRGFRPTYAAFAGEAELGSYESGRRRFYSSLLGLPAASFRGARLAEWGPDTGENALVFARWGAQLTLLEPNVLAHPVIEEYFARFALRDKLDEIRSESVEEYEPNKRFDFINAEGFLYTVKPTRLWLDKLAAQLTTDGRAIANFLAESGSLFELFWAALHRRWVEITGQNDVENAWRLFGPKWESIPHTRTFDSWVKDVLENPFVRHSFLIDPVEFVKEAYDAGLGLEGSWPVYSDPLTPHWHKALPRESELLARRQEHIERSTLSYCFAANHFFCGPLGAARELAALVRRTVVVIDSLIDAWNDALGVELDELLLRVSSWLERADVMGAEDLKTRSRLVLMSMRKAVGAMRDASASVLQEQMATDRALVDTWGAPTHYVVLRPM